MSGSQIIVDIDTRDFEELVEEVCDEAAEEAASLVLGRSKRFLQENAKSPTGKLASEIKLKKSKFEGGGVAIEAQGPGNYDRFYATFVELGSVRNPQPIPYLRAPLEQSKREILNIFKERLK